MGRDDDMPIETVEIVITLHPFSRKIPIQSPVTGTHVDPSPGR